MSNSNIRMVDRKFQLTGKLNRQHLQENQKALTEALQKMNLASSANSQLYEDYIEIMNLLKTGSFEGNEAGAEQYLGFAPTEIEEALRRMGWGEHFEYLKYRHHWHKYPHLLKVREFPVHLGIESSSVCDLRCKMCFQSDTEFKRQKSNFGFMDYELYKRIIDEGAERGLCSAKLSIRGEPILNPMLPQMIAYAREKKLLDVMFDTNANQLDEDKSRAILQAEPHLIIFSVDADTKEIFESIRTGAIFERVLNNITRFLEIKKEESPHSITKTRVQMTVIPEARHEIDAVRQRWQGLVDQIAIKEALIRQHTNDTVRENQRPCRVLWQRLDIHYDGSVWLCDNDCYGKYCVGHVLKESIYEIWHGTKMTRMRELHAERYKHKIEPCKHCDGL